MNKYETSVVLKEPGEIREAVLHIDEQIALKYAREYSSNKGVMHVTVTQVTRTVFRCFKDGEEWTK